MMGNSNNKDISSDTSAVIASRGMSSQITSKEYIPKFKGYYILANLIMVVGIIIISDGDLSGGRHGFGGGLTIMIFLIVSAFMYAINRTLIAMFNSINMTTITLCSVIVAIIIWLLMAISFIPQSESIFIIISPYWFMVAGTLFIFNFIIHLIAYKVTVSYMGSGNKNIKRSSLIDKYLNKENQEYQDNYNKKNK